MAVLNKEGAAKGAAAGSKVGGPFGTVAGGAIGAVFGNSLFGSDDDEATGGWSTKVFDKQKIDAFAQAFANLGVGSKNFDLKGPEQEWQSFATKGDQVTQLSGPSQENTIHPTEDIIEDIQNLKSVFSSRVEQIRSRTAQPGKQQTIFTR